jgi:formylglycine-generating enzyme required for sulfatase activity
VTSLIRDVSPWGVVGLAGGVREWCADEMPGKPEHRAIRGGSVVHPRTPWLPDPPLDPDLFAAAREGSALQASKMNDVGFRCVLRLQAVAEAARAGEPPASDVSGRTEPAVFNGERKE